MARLTWTIAPVTATRDHRTPRPGNRLQQSRSMGGLPTTCAEHRTQQRGLAEVRLSFPQRPRGYLERHWFNRRMRKTAHPVVWEGGGAQSPSLDSSAYSEFVDRTSSRTGPPGAAQESRPTQAVRIWVALGAFACATGVSAIANSIGNRRPARARSCRSDRPIRPGPDRSSRSRAFRGHRSTSRLRNRR